MNRPILRACAVLASVSSLVFGVACTSSTVINESEQPTPEPKANPAEPPAEAPKPAAPTPDPSPGEPGKSGEGKVALPTTSAGGAKGAKDGDACDKADDCASGVCEGEGCGPKQGKCAPKDRQCTMDLRPYCGCDGKSFQSGGNCPKKRYSKKGACDGDPIGPTIIKKP